MLMDDYDKSVRAAIEKLAEDPQANKQEPLDEEELEREDGCPSHCTLAARVRTPVFTTATCLAQELGGSRHILREFPHLLRQYVCQYMPDQNGESAHNFKVTLHNTSSGLLTNL
jgi:hypothetical protein